MSDKTKAEQFLERWFPRSIPKDDFDRHGAFVITWADAEEVMQSYADQEKKKYLKDVLMEVENDFKARIYITLSNTKTIDMNETLKHQLTKEIWNTSKEVLTHLKQTKG